MKPRSATRHALVTGAGGTLGRAFCRQLAREGWTIAAVDWDAQSAESTLAEVLKAGGSGETCLLDVTDREAWFALIARLRNAWPRLDLLVNSAGISGTGEIGSAMDEFRRIVDVNFWGTANGCHAAAEWLKSSGPGGHIINIGSIFGLIPPPTMGAYATSKAAVVAFSETLYGELRPHGVGVTVVSPGFFPSSLLDEAEFAENAHRQIATDYMNAAQLTAEEVVGQTLQAVRRNQLHVVLGRKAQWIARLKRWLPRLTTHGVLWQHTRRLNQFDKNN